MLRGVTGTGPGQRVLSVGHSTPGGESPHWNGGHTQGLFPGEEGAWWALAGFLGLTFQARKVGFIRQKAGVGMHRASPGDKRSDSLSLFASCPFYR